MRQNLINANGIIDCLYHDGFDKFADDLAYIHNEIANTQDDTEIDIQSLLKFYEFITEHKINTDDTSVSVSHDGNISLTWTIAKNKNIISKWGTNYAIIVLEFDANGMIHMASTTGHLPIDQINQLRIRGLFDHDTVLDIVNYFINKMDGTIQ